MNKIRQVIAQEDTILFVGSGLSLWSGLPTWGGLIEELAVYVESTGRGADLIRAEAARGDLLQAASYGFDALTKHQIGEFIRAACRYGIAKPHEIHRLAVSLGTRCFITTNYDNLLEEAIKTWRPEKFFRAPITNRHLTETAEIIHARAVDFIFKPHGDAGDTESIVLTREQYRQLLPQGERHSALESLRILLASRPVVYLGFGLRDPDFLYIRDILANTYKGGVRDHFAIIADASQAEVDYWRRNYGIHLIAYETTSNSNGSKNHSALVEMLRTLSDSQDGASSSISAEKSSGFVSAPETVLSLARHASRLSRIPKAAKEFPIRVHAEDRNRIGLRYDYRNQRFNDYFVQRFLADGPEKVILLGLPGAGKTYALKQAAARLAEKLHELCLSEPFDESSAVVPIFVDLKMYRGDLVDLVGQTLPKSVPFQRLVDNFRCKIFLDAFNEMPREIWESGVYEADFTRFLEKFDRASLVIGSRTRDGLDKLDLPVYCLDEIDEDVINVELDKIGLTVESRFDVDVKQLLQKPFYFQLLLSGKISLPANPQPRDFYQSLFAKLQRDFDLRFGVNLDISRPLSIAAYDAINRGEEAYPLKDLLRTLGDSISSANAVDINAADLANWLVSASIIIPYTGARVAFVHQSITEYLAATELAIRYRSNPQILKEKLVFTRWDQALFLTLSLLPKEHADNFFNEILAVNFELALSAAKYVEIGRDEVVAKLLSSIISMAQETDVYEPRIDWILERHLPVSLSHEGQLRELIELGDSIGGAAVKLFVQLKGGNAVKDELFALMLKKRADYNFCCNGIAAAIQAFVTKGDVDKIVKMADSIEHEITADSDDEVAHGFTIGAAALLEGVDLSTIRKRFLPAKASARVPEIRARILCNLLWAKHSSAALDLAADLLLRGVDKAATAIYFIARFAKAEEILSWDAYTPKHVDRLISLADDPSRDTWSLRALQLVCSGRADLASFVAEKAANARGIARAALISCATGDGGAELLKELSESIAQKGEVNTIELSHYLGHFDINWRGSEQLFMQVLRLRDVELATTVLCQAVDGVDFPFTTLDIGEIRWWLDWLQEISKLDDGDMLLSRISSLFAQCLSEKDQDAFLLEFNKAESVYRPLLSRHILLRRHNISTDDFSAGAVSFLLSELNDDMDVQFDGCLLGKAATEAFIVDRLLPLLNGAKKPLLHNIERIVRDAGSRHGKRYLVS